MTNPGNAVGTNGGYGGRTSVNAFNDVLSAFTGRGIVNGWACVPKSGMTVSLGGQELIRDFAIAVNDIGQSTTLDNISTQPIDVTLSDAPTLGSRIDVIVGYVTNPPDSNGELIDNPDTCGLIVVEGSVTTNPTAPDEAMIREAITADGGSGVSAYYVILAIIQVGTGMTTITGAEITPGPKTKISDNVISNNVPLKVYLVTPDPNGILNIVDDELPSTPTLGMHFVVQPSTNVSNPRISLNGGTSTVITEQRIAATTDTRPTMTSMQVYNNYELVYIPGAWRCISQPAKITPGDADVGEIMDYAGNNQLAFGLGGACIDMGNTDFNNFPLKTGFYMSHGNNCPPVQAGTDNWWYVEQMVHNNNYRVQVARSFFGDSQIWHRICRSGVWQNWVRISTIDQTYPVGSHYISYTLDTPGKVATALGGGTWIRTAEGQVIVGYKSSDADFNANAKQGGSKTQTLSALIGAVNNNTSTLGNVKGTVPTGHGAYDYGITGTALIGTKTASDATSVLQTNGNAPTTLQPYITRYVYVRTA